MISVVDGLFLYRHELMAGGSLRNRTKRRALALKARDVFSGSAGVGWLAEHFVCRDAIRLTPADIAASPHWRLILPKAPHGGNLRCGGEIDQRRHGAGDLGESPPVGIGYLRPRCVARFTAREDPV